MKIGFFGFNNGVLAESEAMARALKAMDEAGFESAWTGEHVVLIDPQEPPSPAPPDFPMLDTVAAGFRCWNHPAHPAGVRHHSAGAAQSRGSGQGAVGH